MFSDHFYMLKKFSVVAILFLIFVGRIFPNDLSKALEFMSKGDYSNAIEVLSRIPRDQKNERMINYYLCESYFLLKDFTNSLRFGESVIATKGDFFYKKSLYDVVFSYYMINDFSKAYIYGDEYLNSIGDSQGVESLVLTMVVSSLQSIGNIDKAYEILTKYKDKYPTLYSSLSKSIEKFSKSYQSYYTSKVGQEQHEKTLSEEEKLRLYYEIVNDILSGLEKISSKKDLEIEKLNDIIELLELKESALKLKKYRIMLGD